MNLDTFLASRPLFTTHELDDFLATLRPVGEATLATARQSLLSYHRQAGHVLPIRRGLWASVPAHRTPGQQPIDSLLVASRLTLDAVIAYHGALTLHGLAHSLRQEVVVLSAQSFVNPLRFRGTLYRAVPPPSELPSAEALTLGVETWNRQGLDIRVTSLERTVVDCLDRPSLSGGWEEVWRSLESLDAYLDFEKLIDYALKLQTATTAAKVGYFLSQSAVQKRLKVPEAALDRLRASLPKRAHYVQRGVSSKFMREWNLLVPRLAGEEETEDILV
jgi:predicted transcriptional regulator of viral defense system